MKYIMNSMPTGMAKKKPIIPKYNDLLQQEELINGIKKIKPNPMPKPMKPIAPLMKPLVPKLKPLIIKKPR